MSDESTRPDLEVEERIEASPEEVFEYVSDPARFPGSPSPLTRGEEIDREAPRRIAWRAGDGTVEVVLLPDGSGTRVRVTHRFEAARALLIRRCAAPSPPLEEEGAGVGGRMLALAA